MRQSKIGDQANTAEPRAELGGFVGNDGIGTKGERQPGADGVDDFISNRTMRCVVRNRSRPAASVVASMSLTSPPALNVPPAPVITMARTAGSGSIRSMASTMACRIGIASALRRAW
jgi:hypothetical protein